MSKEKKTAVENEDVVDAKELANVNGTTAVVPSSGTAPAVFEAKGMSLAYSYVVLMKGGNPEWRDVATGQPPVKGDFYVRKSAGNAHHLGTAGQGQDKGFVGILINDNRAGWRENVKTPYNPAQKVVPRRFWTTDEIVQAGLSPIVDPNKKLKDNDVAPIISIGMLARLPDDFMSMEYQTFKVGAHLYTPVRVEFTGYDVQNFSGTGVTQVLNSWRERAMLQHRNEEGYEFTFAGQMCHVYSTAQQSRNGMTYTSMHLEGAIRDGKLFTYDEEETADLARVLELLKGSTITEDQIVSDDAE